MKKIDVIVRIVVLVAIVVVVLFHVRYLSTVKEAIGELQDENASLRSKNDTLRALFDEQQNHISKLGSEVKLDKASISELERANADLRAKNKELAEKLKGEGVEVATTDGTPGDDGEEETETESTPVDPKSSAAMRDYLKKMLSSPEMRDMLWQSTRSSLDLTMKDLFTSLDLTPDELGKFKDMLTEKQLTMLEKGMDLADQNLSDDDRKALEAEMKERIDEIDGKAKELLGDARYEEYENYMDTVGDRMVLSQYKSRLAESGVEGINERQEQELLLALSDERKNFTFSSDFANQNNYDFDRFTQENVEKYYAERKRLADNMLERSRSILTEKQLEQFKASLESQMQMEKMQMEMAAKLFSGDSNVEGKTPSEGASGTGSDNPDTGEEEGSDTPQDTGPSGT